MTTIPEVARPSLIRTDRVYSVRAHRRPAAGRGGAAPTPAASRGSPAGWRRGRTPGPGARAGSAPTPARCADGHIAPRRSTRSGDPAVPLRLRTVITLRSGGPG